jgi:predicted O-methyltransferase YrrM
VEADMVFIDIEKKQYTDTLKTLPKRLSEINIPVFQFFTTP